MLKVIVTTYPRNAYLLDKFHSLLKKFWNRDYEIDIAKPDEKLSNQLSRIVNTIKDDYFILLKEDFYFLSEVDKNLMAKCEEFAVQEGVDRFSLQSVEDGYKNTSEVYKDIGGLKIFRILSSEKYLCSLEASIWKRQFLLDNLFLGGSDRDVELNMSKQVKGFAKIFVPEKKILDYTDALRGGQERIKWEGNKMILLTPDGWQHKLTL